MGKLLCTYCRLVIPRCDSVLYVAEGYLCGLGGFEPREL